MAIKENTDKEKFLEGYIHSTQRIHALREQLQSAQEIKLELSQLKKCGEDIRELENRTENLLQRVRAQIKDEYEYRNHVRKVIEKVQDERARQTLQLRYLEGVTWEKVAEIMLYSTTHMRRIHRQALAELDI